MREKTDILSIIMPVAALILILVMILIMAFAIYKSVYKHRINKRLAEGREADIKPMMSPVKFVIITLLIIIVSIILLLAGLNVLLRAGKTGGTAASTSNPAILYFDTDNADSPFEGYRFGDDIKGYNKQFLRHKELCMAIYTAKEEYASALPAALIAVDRSSDKNYAFYGIDLIYYDEGYSAVGERSGDKFDADRLYVVNTNGYIGKFDIAFCIGYELSDNPGKAMYRRSSADYDEYIRAEMERDGSGMVYLMNQKGVTEE